MRLSFNTGFLFGFLTMLGILLCNNLWSQTSDTTHTINIPLPYEDLSLYDFAEIRMESNKSEKPPADIIKRNFQPVKEIFEKDDVYFNDSIQNVWIKFNVRNNLAKDTSVALIFPYGTSKAVLRFPGPSS